MCCIAWNTALVSVGVVRVRHVGMPMPQRLVPVPVAVFASRHGVMHVAVMPVVMAMCVLMLLGFVLVLVLVAM